MDLSSSVSANSTTATVSPATNLPSTVSANSTTTTTAAVGPMNLTSVVPTSSTTTVASTAMDLPSSVSANSTTVTVVGLMNLTSTVSHSSTTVSTPMNLPSSASANSTTAAIGLPSTVSANSTTVSTAMDLPSSVSANSTTTVSPAMDLPSTISANSTTTVSPAMDLPSSVSANSTTSASTAMDLPSTVSANSTTVTAVTDPSSAAVSPSSTTTVPVYEIPSEEINCRPINDTNVIVNTTSVKDGTVVHVACQPSFTLVAPRTNTDFVTCLGGRWIPLTPTCNPVQSNSAPVGVIVGCTVGGVVCLVLVIVALYMLNKSIKERKDQRERNKEFYEKMDQIGSYINASFQDPVGMPVLTMDTRDTDLRGRVAMSTSNPSASSEKEEPPDAGKLGADLF